MTLFQELSRPTGKTYFYPHTHTHSLLSVKDGKPNLNPPKKTRWPQCLSDPTILINEKHSVYVRDTDSDGSQNKTQGFFFVCVAFLLIHFFSQANRCQVEPS